MTIDESMDDIEKALHILDIGQPVQKQAVFERLEAFILQDQDLRIFTAAVVTIMQRMLPLAPEGMQIAAAKSFRSLIETTFTPDLNETVLALTVEILSVWSAPVHEAWLPVFKMLVGKVRKDLLNTTILRDILKLGDINRAKTFRTAACTMTPALAPYLPEGLSRQLIKKSFSLSQDIEYSVRLRMAKELAQLFVIGTSFVQNQLWNEILKLLEDDNEEVKKEALYLLMKSLKHLTSSFRKDQALPIVLKVLSGPFATDVLLPQAAECLQTCIKDLESMQKLCDFMDFYRLQLISPNPDLALMATRNLPGVLLALEGQHPEYDNLLLGVVRSSKANCRRIIAAAMPDIAMVYINKPELVQIAIEDLLDDTAAQPVILKTLPKLTGQLPLDKLKIYNRLLVTMRLSNWRVQYSSLVAVQCLLSSLNPSYIRDSLPDILTSIMQTGALPARSKAAEVAAQMLSRLAYSEFRQDFLSNLALQLAKSHKHMDRQIYLDFALHAVHWFSRRFFKVHLLDVTLSLSRDLMVSVKAKFLRLVPAFRMGMNPETSPALSDIVNQLMDDPDKTVSEAACDAHAAMLHPDFWKKLDSDELLNADQLKERTETQMLAEEQRILDDIKKQFVDQLATRAKLGYKNRKQMGRLNPRASVKTSRFG